MLVVVIQDGYNNVREFRVQKSPNFSVFLYFPALIQASHAVYLTDSLTALFKLKT